MSPDPLTAFQSLQDASALAPAYLGNPAHSLRAKATRILLLNDALKGPQDGETDPESIALAQTDPDILRAEITALVKTLTWPLKTKEGIEDRPLTLTLEKEDLIRRLWRQDSEPVEMGRKWSTDAKTVLYCALHGPATFRIFYSNIQVQLVDVYDFYRVQITTDQEKELMCLVMDALWEGHRVNMAIPAPAPFGAHASGN